MNQGVSQPNNPIGGDPASQALDRIADALLLMALEAAAATPQGLTGDRRDVAVAVFERIRERER